MKQIGKVVGRSDFDQLSALYSHRHSLTKERSKIDQLLVTIDKTIKHLKGENMMEDQEMYQGFQEWAKGKGTESYFLGVCSAPD